jgi:hypothetical protein
VYALPFVRAGLVEADGILATSEPRFPKDV